MCISDCQRLAIDAPVLFCVQESLCDSRCICRESEEEEEDYSCKETVTVNTLVANNNKQLVMMITKTTSMMKCKNGYGSLLAFHVLVSIVYFLLFFFLPPF